MSQSQRSIGVGPHRQLWFRGVAALVIVIVLSAAFLTFMFWKVCEQQVTQGGQVVNVCRHLQVTDPPVLAGAAALVVALGAFFSEVGAFGISLKREVADAKDAADSAKAASESATRAADVAGEVSRKAEEAAEYAQGAERSVARAEQIFTQLAASQRQPPAASEDIDENLRELAAEYNALRRDFPPGAERTERMTSVVARMIALANGVAPGVVDVGPWMGADDRGLRLAAYAFLHTHPVPALTPRLAQSAVEEDKPFGQYWALRALRRQVALDREALDLNSRRRLEELLAQVGPGTDRGYELRQLLGAR